VKALTYTEAANKTAEALGILDERVTSLYRRFNAINISDGDSKAVSDDAAEFRFNLDILDAVSTVLRINCR
jgi:hypothetical protein